MPKIILLCCLLAVLSACNLTRTPPTEEVLPTIDGTAAGDGRPAVTISSPQNGAEVVVDTDVFVSANATDSVGITRVQLIANNQIVKTVSSESVAGDKNMNVLLDFRPAATGPLALEVIAYRGEIASDPATVSINVRANQAQVTATIVPQTQVPIIDPNDPTCRALTNVALNVRTGPGTQFPRVTTLAPGVQVPIIGRVGDNSWWLVRVSNVTSGWVIQRNPLNPNEEFIAIFGVCAAIPIVNPPPSPTFLPPPPTHTPTRTPTSPPPPTTPPLPPDLIVAGITGPTALVHVGPDLVETYSITISNIGQANSGSFVSSIQLNDADPVDLGSANLNGGESIALNFDITFEAPGVYTITVIADSGGTVTESLETNNSDTLDVGVVAG
jgi:hypothetical protein